MNPVTELHNEAMRLAEEAHYAKLKGQLPASREKYRLAFKKEKQAALKLKDDVDAEPNRSVLLRSAASLAFVCEELDDAQKLIEIALGGHPPTEIRDELLELSEQVKRCPPITNSAISGSSFEKSATEETRQCDDASRTSE